jgi:hypothetical protein
MIGWLVVVAVNVAIVALAVRASRRPEPRRALGRLAYVCFGLLVITSGSGVIWGLGRAIAAVSTPIDASQKAALLAEGISETLNLAAFGVVTFFLPIVVTLVLLRRAPR